MKKHLLLIIFLAFAVFAYSQDAPSSFTANVKGGLLLASNDNIEVSDFDMTLDSKTSPFLKADLDAILMPKLSMGVYALFTPIGIKDSDSKGNLFSFGGTIKPRFTLSSGLQVRPGIAIGYNSLTSEDFDDPSKGLNVGFQLELAKKVNDKLGIVGEFGFITQPVGGIKDVTDITYAPIFYLCLGIEFGK